MTSKILDDFMQTVDKNNNYSLDELKKLLSEAYKGGKKKKATTEKKEPSEYNIFIKEEIAKIRKDNASVDNKQLMSLAASRWKEYKLQKSAENESNTNTSS